MKRFIFVFAVLGVFSFSSCLARFIENVGYDDNQSKNLVLLQNGIITANNYNGYISDYVQINNTTEHSIKIELSGKTQSGNTEHIITYTIPPFRSSELPTARNGLRKYSKLILKSTNGQINEINSKIESHDFKITVFDFIPN